MDTGIQEYKIINEGKCIFKTYSTNVKDVIKSFLKENKNKDLKTPIIIDLAKKKKCLNLHKAFSDKDEFCPVCNEPFNSNF